MKASIISVVTKYFAVNSSMIRHDFSVTVRFHWELGEPVIIAHRLLPLSSLCFVYNEQLIKSLLQANSQSVFVPISTEKPNSYFDIISFINMYTSYKMSLPESEIVHLIWSCPLHFHCSVQFSLYFVYLDTYKHTAAGQQAQLAKRYILTDSKLIIIHFFSLTFPFEKIWLNFM